MRKAFVNLWLLGAVPWLWPAQQSIPTRPEDLAFPELVFEVPSAKQFFTRLRNGIPAYLAEDRQFPLVSIRILFRGGSYLEPSGKEGLANLTGIVWRTGGAGDLSPRQLDEEVDFLAASIATGIGETSGSISLNLLSKDLDRGLELLMELVKRPRFDPERFEKARSDALQALKRRNDSTDAIEARQWRRLIYGDDFWLNREATQVSLQALTRQDLIEFCRRLLNPEEMVVAAAGDFNREDLEGKLNQTVGQLTYDGVSLPAIPQPQPNIRPGVYLVDKPDVNQGRVSIGHLGLMRPVEEEFDIRVANDVLGGGGFTSWILSRVRSDEGLAYSAGSSFSIGDQFPGTFRASFQSKSATVARATQLTVELIERLTREGISEEELAISQASFIQTFPNRFQSAAQTVGTFARDDLANRPHSYWETFRDRVAKVTTESTRAAAERYIRPQDFVILVVGNIEEILRGHPDYPDARLEGLGPVVRLPLLDPLTLTPLNLD